MTKQKTVQEFVDPSFAGARIDKWSYNRLPNIPASAIQKFLRTGDIKVNDKRAFPSLRLCENDMISIYSKLIEENENRATHSPKIKIPDEIMNAARLWVIYEDEHVIAFNKPAGIASQGGTRQSVSMDMVAETLYGYEKNLQQCGKFSVKLAHRLDKQTSGVLLFSRTISCARTLAAMFRDRSIEKEYIAIVHNFPKDPEGTIDTPLIKTSWNGGAKMVCSMQINTQFQRPPYNTSMALSAVTKYEVVRKFCKNGAHFSFIKIIPETGRTHQIRAHMAHIGCPVVGDFLYGNLDRSCKLKEGMMLHCRSVSFSHPATSAMTNIRANDPERFDL
ncbi:RluA family pseudouridine synthase [Candidatus Hydrogenosomobacter endosymbioticus]|uniref:Pseudouridine synthase n=1 Tax=Candidatus Hydrogenosomobacter endosymbioticus TaxID=2558174 RepID=A0ABN6L3P0_9PROT|nr:RluA family pseudouridine synthase [Candidatus Hydrogenosomobacter endosymbioticus]BDB96532.1 pseudouridine synthase [Candidatus Hydrogenosomobacter endosymbioticus]